MALAEVPRRQRRFPSEYEGRDSQRLGQNTKVEILNVSKQDLIDDFEDSPEVVKSGLYKHIYTAEFGQFGGQPVGAVVSNYTFGPGPQDMELLRNVASVSAMSHVPFLGAAGKEFFGIDSWDELPNLKDLHSIFEMPQYTKWRSLRENEDSRYLGLTLPRSRADASALPASPALRREHDAGEELQLY